MKEQRSYFSRALVILMAVMLIFTMMPSGMWGSVETAYAAGCPVTVTAGGNTLTATATTETVTDSYLGTAKVYTVAVPAGTTNVTIAGYSGGNILTYNYDANKNWLAGSYTDYGVTGETESTRAVDSNNDNVADYIWVQTPYDSTTWVGNFICVIKLVYQLPVSVTIGDETITTTDTWVKDGYTYQDEWSNDKSDLYVINAEKGTTQVSIKKADDSAFLAYNYGIDGWLNGKYDSTVGVKSVTLNVDHDGDGASDYIRIQNLYNADYSGGELLYALQFIVDGGLPITKDGVTVAALSEREQEAAIKKAVASIEEKTEYCTDSDWVTALYSNGGSLSTDNQKAYLKKVYGDIVDSASLGTLAKDVIALVAMGYDPTKIQDTEGNNYNLLAELYNSDIADLGPYGIYTAPYILLAYDSYKFELPETASLTRDNLINYMISQQGKDGSWGGYTYGGVDYPGTAGDTASVAQALLPYSEKTNVATAISNANDFIEKNLTGSTSSTNYLAYIVQYEAMQGKKASEFTVDSEAGTDVIDYLLSYKLDDNTFEYGTDGKTNKTATIDAFKALVAYKNLTDGVSTTSANIYDSSSKYYYGLSAVTGLPSINSSLSDIFIKAPTKLTYKVGETIDLTGLEVTAQATDGTKSSVSTAGITNDPQTITEGTQLSYSGFDTTTAGTKTVTVKYEVYDTYLGKSIAKTADFIITVNAADGSSTSTKNAVSIGVYDADGKVVVKSNSYTIEVGKTTVMDVLKAVLGNNGKTYTLKASGTYIAEIDGLGEFDKGENSGWMYKVDGTLPEIAASSYTLKGGEYIYWFYTKDWTKVSGATTMATSDVTTDTKTDVTTGAADVKVTDQTAADGTKEKVATVTVSSSNQKEILKQAKASKSKEIVLNASSSTAKDASKVDVNLDKSFVNSIVSDTDAKLTIKTPLGDKTYTQDELKTLAAAATGSTVVLTIEKSATDDTANVEKATSGAEKAYAKARSVKTKSGVKVTYKPNTDTQNYIDEMKDLGYTVKYRFYRSTKKSSGYKAMLTKTSKTYTNLNGKADTRYYYKVQVRVYDANGKLVAKTALKQCKYATRIFG